MQIISTSRSGRAFVLVVSAVFGLLQTALPCAAGGGPVPLRRLVTDAALTSLPSTFGSLPPSETFNQAGDYLFTSGGGSALFLRRAGESAIVRILQMGDPVPGFAHSRADLISGVRLNQSGQACFQVDFFMGDTTKNAILIYDGSTFRTVAYAGDVAPDSGGSVFGRSMSLTGFNDSGAVAFTAPLVALGATTGTPVHTAVFIAPAAGTPVRIVGQGDPAPDTAGGTLDVISGSGFNNRGDVLFRVTVVGGSGGYGAFVGSASRRDS